MSMYNVPIILESFTDYDRVNSDGTVYNILDNLVCDPRDPLTILIELETETEELANA